MRAAAAAAAAANDAATGDTGDVPFGDVFAPGVSVMYGDVPVVGCGPCGI